MGSLYGDNMKKKTLLFIIKTIKGLSMTCFVFKKLSKLILCGFLLINIQQCLASFSEKQPDVDTLMGGYGLAYDLPIPTISSYKLLCVKNGYTDEDLGGLALSFMDLSVNKAKNPEWKFVYDMPSRVEQKGMVLYAFNSYLYVGGNKGVARFKEGDKDCQMVCNGLPQKVTVLALHAYEGDLYAGTYEHGVFKTSDGGLNWIAVGANVRSSIRFLYSYNGYIFACASDGLYRSNNKGESWAKISDAVVTILQEHNDNLYAGTQKGLFKSYDNGDIWEQLIEDKSIDYLYSFGEALYVIANCMVDRGIWGVKKAADLLKTTNDGKEWRVVSKNPALEEAVALFSSDKNLYLVTGDGGIYEANSAGEDWTVVTSEKNFGKQDNVDSNDPGFVPYINEVIFTYKEGEWSPEYKETELVVETGYVSNLFEFYNDSLYVITNRGVYKNNLTLTVSPFLLQPHVQPGCLYKGGNYGLFKADDGGAGWEKKNEGFVTRNNAGLSGLWVKDFSSHDGRLYAATENGIYCTENDGETWQNVYSGHDVNALFSFGGYLYAGLDFGVGVVRNESGGYWSRFGYDLSDRISITKLAVFKGYLYAASSYSGIHRVNGMYMNWDKVSKIDAILLLVSEDYLFAVSKEGVVFKTEDGVSWNEVNNEKLKGKEITGLYHKDGLFYVSTKDGEVLKTDDNGDSWEYADNIVSNEYINILHLHNGYLFAGTIMQGVFRTKEKIDSI